MDSSDMDSDYTAYPKRSIVSRAASSPFSDRRGTYTRASTMDDDLEAVQLSTLPSSSSAPNPRPTATGHYRRTAPAITAPIPGMIVPEQVDNAALAVMERRELDTEEQAQLDRANQRAWANLTHEYEWLKEWEYV